MGLQLKFLKRPYSNIITFDQVVNAVRRSSIDVQVCLRSDNGNILLRAKGQAYDAYDFANLVNSRPDDETLSWRYCD